MQLKALLFLSSITYSFWVTAGLTEREKDDFVYDLSLATQGIMVSQFNTGVNYYLGIGIHRDMEKSVYWHQEASKQGHSKAPFNLALIFARGNEVPKDLKLSMNYLDLAAERGNEEALRFLKQIKENQTDDKELLQSLDELCCPQPLLHQKVYEIEK